MNILVTGGAGYIGSHSVRDLVRRGHDVTIVDRFLTGHRAAVRADLVEVDVGDAAAITRICEQRRIEGAIHFAASAAAGESVRDPGKYFQNNVAGTIGLLNGLVEAAVRFFVFSSSSAVYGTPTSLPVAEDAPMHPESPYGESKLMCEQMLPWYEQAHGLRWVALRYFNAAGAALDGELGDDVRPATRILPIALEVALGIQPAFALYGDDYPTPDGTCLRDYIHVEDLSHAHTLAMEHLASGGASGPFNVAFGRAYSNFELLACVKRVTGVDFPIVVRPRRPGDPAVTQGDISKIRRVLGWQPEHDLETMVHSAWAWRRSHPEGYPH